MKPVAEAACELPWLAPCAGSLVALTRGPGGGGWPALRHDPGLVLLLVRDGPRGTSALSFYSALLHDPNVLELAGRCLAQAPAAFVNWHQPALLPIYRAALACARTAEALARLTDRCDPEQAWVGGLLAPLGWMAAATDARAAAQCLDTFAVEPDAVRLQRRLWGLDAHALARRLAVAWQLPDWLTAVVAHLGLPLDVARSLGAEPEHFLVVQLAVTLVEQNGLGLRLPVGAARAELMQALELSEIAAGAVVEELRLGIPTLVPPRDWQAPAETPLLADLLRLAGANRTRTGREESERLHVSFDALRDATLCRHAREETRLQELKLRALAEVAAGAGHEINNPLAVISGQAQYLLVSEQEPARRKALQTIINQTQRIHQTLIQLMQFARPPVPRKQPVDLRGLVHEVIVDVQSLADERQVRLDFVEPPVLTLLIDPGQIRTALAALVRNGVEAAPAGGWVNVLPEHDQNGGVRIAVEDSGPGPAPADREHLFDPFWSGRKAGRGRGLGLPTAWQLARQHGGDVRFEDAGTTRFVLTLPADAIAEPTPPADRNGCCEVAQSA
jgi:signal transduction histidine kinase